MFKQHLWSDKITIRSFKYYSKGLDLNSFRVYISFYKVFIVFKTVCLLSRVTRTDSMLMGFMNVIFKGDILYHQKLTFSVLVYCKYCTVNVGICGAYQPINIKTGNSIGFLWAALLKTQGIQQAIQMWLPSFVTFSLIRTNFAIFLKYICMARYHNFFRISSKGDGFSCDD